MTTHASASGTAAALGSHSASVANPNSGSHHPRSPAAVPTTLNERSRL